MGFIMANKDIKIHDENDRTIYECKLDVGRPSEFSVGKFIKRLFLIALVVACAVAIGYLLSVRRFFW